MVNVRNLVLRAVNRTVYEGAYSNRITDEFCKELTDIRDRAFFTKLYLGTIEKLLLLDIVIEYLTGRKIKKIQRPVSGILRISLYQVLFMDSVPDPVAVSEAQILCDINRLKPAKGFVNGVLRNAVRKKDVLPEEALGEYEGEERLAIEASIPFWMYRYIKESVGEDKIKLLINNLSSKHFLSVRILTGRKSLEEAAKVYEEAGLCPERFSGLPAIRLGKSVPANLIPGIKEGWAYIQDISSIRAVSSMELNPGDDILDICSAPGGKGLYASDLVNPGKVILRDISENKIKIIENNARACGAGNVVIEARDALDFDAELEGKLDGVIADVPCSGLGTIGNKPEIKYRVNKFDIEKLVELQQKILDVAVRYVKPGGKLLFSTCTLSKSENDDNVEWFLKRHDEFSEVKRETLLPDGKGSDGFFYCLFAKR